MDSLEWPENVTIREMATGRDRKRDQQFIFCEDISTLRKVSALPGKAGWVWLLVGHRSRVTKSTWVTLPQRLLDTWGIGRSSKSRALELLQELELVEVECVRGSSARVRLKSKSFRLNARAAILDAQHETDIDEVEQLNAAPPER
jgi:hypothetical protein